MTSWKKDVKGIFVLTVLYLMQGVPMGMIFGSLPFMLSEKLTYADQAIFSLAAYPYSLKLLWSPIVDVVYSSDFGRRKSWIFPMQIMMGLTMIYIGYYFDSWVGIESNEDEPQVIRLTLWFFWLIFLTATQDIAVDGWALTILAQENIQLQATCQTFGMTLGYAIGFPVFLALNSVEICSKYFGSESALLTINSFFISSGVLLLIINILIMVFVSERKPSKSEQLQLNELSIKSTYVDIIRVISIPNVIKLICICLTCRMAFTCVDSVTQLKLNEKGFPKEMAGILVFFYMPFELFNPLILVFINRKLNLRKLEMYKYGYCCRIFVSLLIIYCVFSFKYKDKEIPFFYYVQNIVIAILQSMTSAMMFTSQCAFFASIADVTIGGTYLTLLNTVSNLGSIWPRYFVLRFTDYFTVRNEIECEFNEIGVDDEVCFEIIRDGYYVVSVCSLLVGCLWIYMFRSTIMRFGDVPKDEWTISRKNKNG